MKTSRKAAHLLAGSIMTAATIVGGAGVAAAADAPRVDLKGEPAADSYYKVVLEDLHLTSYQLGVTGDDEELSAVYAKITHLKAKDGGTSEVADFFLKIGPLPTETGR